MLLFSYCLLSKVIIINALLLTDEWNISSDVFSEVLSLLTMWNIWADNICACCFLLLFFLFFFWGVIWLMVLIAPWLALIDKPSFTLDFLWWTYFFQITLLYSNLFTFLAIKLPSVHYLLLWLSLPTYVQFPDTWATIYVRVTDILGTHCRGHESH